MRQAAKTIAKHTHWLPPITCYIDIITRNKCIQNKTDPSNTTSSWAHHVFKCCLIKAAFSPFSWYNSHFNLWGTYYFCISSNKEAKSSPFIMNIPMAILYFCERCINVKIFTMEWNTRFQVSYCIDKLSTKQLLPTRYRITEPDALKYVCSTAH